MISSKININDINILIMVWSWSYMIIAHLEMQLS